MLPTRTTLAVGTCLLTLSGVLVAAPGAVATTTSGRGYGRCSAGARTLSAPGDHVYPDTGNGGYRSIHTDVHMVYDSASNRFLPGNHVDLLDAATQCLTEFSLDLERTSAAGTAGPDLTVSSVLVDGRSVPFRFAQPTYPGDPHGADDPDPRAHQAGQHRTVGGPLHNPLPPACAPQVTGDDPDANNGEACNATKLVITPPRPVRAGEFFLVTVNYTGRPGVHQDGDGSNEGWFRSDNPRGDGGFVTTEPVGTEDWMPLNNHPSAKPTYAFYDTVNAGKTAVANGILLGSRSNRPDANFPGGSTTWFWNSLAPVASYLVENSVGSFDLTSRIARSGIRFYEVQSSSIPADKKQANLAIMNQQADITAFQSRFNGPFPFPTDGVLIGRPDAGFEEEMQTMITFANSTIDLDTFNHENMHQWWGDHVSEANYDMTFFKEGLATFGEYLFHARTAATKAGGLDTPAGRRAFEASLTAQFDTNYARTNLWSAAPSDPTPNTLFSGKFTYTRPGTAYIALRRILGSDRFDSALQFIQRRFANASITEAQLEGSFGRFLPTPSRECVNRLHEFFLQWFDTAYPTAGGATEPAITGPGLDGGGFAGGRCR